MLIELKPAARLCNLRSGVEYDRGSIETHVHKLSQYLALNGIDHGDRVVIADPDPLYYVLAIFACWQVGATAISVNPSLSEDEKQTVLGIFTDGDLRRSLDSGADIHTTRISDVMHSDCTTITAGILAAEAMHILEQNKITSLLVVDDDKKLIGALNIHDLFREGLK